MLKRLNRQCAQDWRPGAQQHRRDRLAELDPLAISGMAVFGVLFSLYRTHQEVFVIWIVCMGCVFSAITMTLLMLISLTPAQQVFENGIHA